MAKVLLGVTGSVASIHTSQLWGALRDAGHSVKIVATKSSRYFFDPATISPIDGRRNREVVVLDEDEWPGARYERGDEVVHIELRRWADVFLIAPVDANTLAKLAGGLADNCLTCVWRAWDRAKPIVLAPAMNTLMWEHPLTRRHLRQIAEDLAQMMVPNDLDLVQTVDWINLRCPNLRIVAPIRKRLACDDVGVGALADRDAIVESVMEVCERQRR